MIISRTPYRISLFGGGTDYPAWYREHGGSVIATTIDKYCYLSCRYLPPFFEHRTRLVYSKIELCKSNADIMHPAVRHTLEYLKLDRGLEIQAHADLPARSGMGSSSTYVVGLLNALHALEGRRANCRQLALEGIHVEQNLLKETVGSQDQVMAAYGGLRHVEFRTDGEIVVNPLTVDADRVQHLHAHLMLFYTGIVRTASDVAQSYVSDIKSRRRQMHIMREMVDEGSEILRSGNDITCFGRLMDKAWQVKRSLSSRVSKPEIDAIYERARCAGALGGKLLGAGGGGFVLLFVPPARQLQVKEALQKLICVPFRFENTGSQIVFCDSAGGHGVDAVLEKDAEFAPHQSEAKRRAA